MVAKIEAVGDRYDDLDENFEEAPTRGCRLLQKKGVRNLCSRVGVVCNGGSRRLRSEVLTPQFEYAAAERANAARRAEVIADRLHPNQPRKVTRAILFFLRVKFRAERSS